jgi:hypothetical protein
MFPGHIIEAHAAGWRTSQDGHRNKGDPDDRLAVANTRINRDAISAGEFHTQARTIRSTHSAIQF